MTERQSFDGSRQRAVLLKLRLRAGREITDLARDVGLSYPQLLRYTSGKTPLRSDHIAAFARAYGVDPVDLSAELAGQDVYPPTPPAPDTADWSFRDALRQGGIPESYIDALAREWEGRPVVNQQSAKAARPSDGPPSAEGLTPQAHTPSFYTRRLPRVALVAGGVATHVYRCVFPRPPCDASPPTRTLGAVGVYGQLIVAVFLHDVGAMLSHHSPLPSAAWAARRATDMQAMASPNSTAHRSISSAARLWASRMRVRYQPTA